MTRSSKRRVRTPDEWTELVRAWTASGRGAASFAEGRDFSASSLYLWRKRLQASGASDDHRDIEPLDFAPVLVDDAESPGEATLWQIETAAGLSITMSGPDAVRGLEVALSLLDGEARR